MTAMDDKPREPLPSWQRRAWTKIKAWLRRDGIVIALFALATIVMSYPLAFRLDGQWVAFRDVDTYMKLWDNWWLRNHAFSEPSLHFTELLFHPNGLDLTFHSTSWTVAFLAWGLTLITDEITAYNMTILVALFATAYAAYLLTRRFVRYRAAAWLAGAIYSFAPYHVAHAGGHPDLAHLAPIPIAVLLLFTAISRPSILAALGAALTIGLAAFTSLYIMVFTLLTVGPILLFLLLDKHRWARRQVWPAAALFIAASTIFLAIRVAPILRDTSALMGAIDLKYTAAESQTDLLSYVLPSHLNPLFAPFTEEIASHLGRMSAKWPAYIGIVTLGLLVSALTWREKRRIVLLWSLIGLMFMFLSLGPALRFNGVLYEGIVLPARYLEWFPPIRAIGRPDYFVLGLLLPLATVAAIGFDRMLISLESRRSLQLALMIGLPALLLVDFWSGQFPGIDVDVPPFYRQLADEPDDFAIIQLPMGRSNSKHYLYLQTIHQKAIVEGLSGRTPPEAYQYIENNALLRNWFRNQPVNCQLLNRQQIISASDQLLADGFRYVIIHHKGSENSENYVGYFDAEPVYNDDGYTAYWLADLRDQPPCQETYERVYELPAPANPTSISWNQEIGLLGYELAGIDPDPDTPGSGTPGSGTPGSGTLPITLFWQALTEMENSYAVYFHLIDKETNSLVAAADFLPRGWSYPTSWWAAGEVVEDTVQIPLENVPSGQYDLYIGWYVAETGQRLPPDSDQLQLTADNSVLLTPIELP